MYINKYIYIYKSEGVPSGEFYSWARWVGGSFFEISLLVGVCVCVFVCLCVFVFVPAWVVGDSSWRPALTTRPGDPLWRPARRNTQQPAWGLPTQRPTRRPTC